MSFEETKSWYDGYSFPFVHSIYSPKSVIESMLSKTFDNYWNQSTEGAIIQIKKRNYVGALTEYQKSYTCRN